MTITLLDSYGEHVPGYNQAIVEMTHFFAMVRYRKAYNTCLNIPIPTHSTHKPTTVPTYNKYTQPEWRNPKHRQTRNTIKTPPNTTHKITNMITSLTKETYAQNKIKLEHQHKKKMTKQIENPHDKKSSKNRIQEKP